MSGDIADFILDSGPDDEVCETCGGEGGHNSNCPDDFGDGIEEEEGGNP